MIEAKFICNILLWKIFSFTWNVMMLQHEISYKILIIVTNSHQWNCRAFHFLWVCCPNQSKQRVLKFLKCSPKEFPIAPQRASIREGLWVLFYILGHGWPFFCPDMLFLFWFSLQGACEGPKIILLFSNYMGEPHRKNTRGNGFVLV